MPSIEMILAAMGWGTAALLYAELLETRAIAEKAVEAAHKMADHDQGHIALPAVIALPDLTEKD